MNLREPAASIVRVGGPPDLLPVIPYIVGFHPASSLVVVCVHRGERLRSGLVMRVDLPDPPAYRDGAREIVARTEFENPDGAVLVCYADEPDVGGALPRHDLIDALTRGFSAGPVEVLDAILVRDGRWWSYLCDDASCCPPGGEPLPDPVAGAAGQAAAEAALRGRVTLGSREELETSVRGPVAGDLVAARRAFDAAGERLLAESRDDGVEAARARTVALVWAVLARYAAGEHELCDDEGARICVGIGDKQARDEIASLPVAERGAWIALLIELARRAPDGDAAPICTTLAWVAYQYGDGALANVALDRALADDPGYSMALVLRDSLDRQVKPSVIRSVSQAVRECWP